jgi:cathepsin L
MVAAFEYVISNKGIISEATWPYTLADHQTCKAKAPYAATISSYKTIASNDEAALKTAVAQQPVSVAIDASQQSFQFYSSGVYDEASCCTNCVQSDLDHGVLVVGYGTENGADYWLVKNSWNSGWGDAGYIKMARNKESQCGIATYASYPIV